MNEDRELLAARVISGRYSLRVRVDGRYRSFILVEPGSAVRAEATEVYFRHKKRAIKRGVSTLADTVLALEKRGMWGKEDEGRLVQTEKDLDDFKLRLYDCRDKKLETRVIREAIASAKAQVSGLLDKKHHHYAMSAEAMASSKRMRFLVGRSLMRGDGVTPFWRGDSFWNDRRVILEDAIAKYLFSRPTMPQIRDLARNDPWRTLWVTREATGNIFGRDSASLSDDQKNLVVWAKVYQNAREDQAPPEEHVFDDDDMFDGFLTHRRNKSKEAEPVNPADKLTTNETIRNADMVFHIVDQEQSLFTSEEVYGLNSETAKNMIQNRMSVINKFGTVEEYAMPDRAQEKRMAMARAPRG